MLSRDCDVAGTESCEEKATGDGATLRAGGGEGDCRRTTRVRWRARVLTACIERQINSISHFTGLMLRSKGSHIGSQGRHPA